MERYWYRAKWFWFKNYRAVLRRGFGINIPKRRKKEYNGKRIVSPGEVNELLYQAVVSGAPDGFCTTRFGVVELRGFAKFDPAIGSIVPEKKILYKLCNNAGFFPATREAGQRFAQVMREACAKTDLLCVWRNPMEDYMMKVFGNDPIYGEPTGLEPYYFQSPWSRALKGKRVLVIHPFVDSIRKQYEENREKLFSGSEVLPEFELITVRAVQTIAGATDPRFKDWFEALDYMVKEAERHEFDVAIIGCGAYGFPLATRLKKEGRVVIHMGGATQMLFGVKGHRWEQMKEFNSIINEHWIRPSEKERPAHADTVEGACYW